MKRCLSIAALVILLGSTGSAKAEEGATVPDELFKKLDSNGDGKLTAAEIPSEHRKFFERLLRIGDANKDGELTRDEFNHALEQKDEPVTDISKVGGLGIGGPGPGVLDPKRLFQMLDKNKDGKLTRDEVSERPRVRALFDRLGKDELTVADLASLTKGAGKPGPNAKKGKGKRLEAALRERGMEQRAAARGGSPLLQLLDTNHDGRLSREEFSKAAELFDQLDRNGDGFLDPKELSGTPPGSPNDEPGAAPSNNRPRKPFRAGLAGGGKAAKGGGLQNGQNMMRLIMNADADGDGKISMEEAPPQLKEHFSQIDTNQDGFLDKSEIETALRNKMHRMVSAPN